MQALYKWCRKTPGASYLGDLGKLISITAHTTSQLFNGATSPGRRCHSTLALAAVTRHSGIYRVLLLPSLS
jgi:hypothetical protein